jgi:hypothetical protein
MGHRRFLLQAWTDRAIKLIIHRYPTLPAPLAQYKVEPYLHSHQFHHGVHKEDVYLRKYHNVSRDFIQTRQYKIFMKIRPVALRLLRAGRRRLPKGSGRTAETLLRERNKKAKSSIRIHNPGKI